MRPVGNGALSPAIHCIIAPRVEYVNEATGLDSLGREVTMVSSVYHRFCGPIAHEPKIVIDGEERSPSGGQTTVFTCGCDERFKTATPIPVVDMIGEDARSVARANHDKVESIGVDIRLKRLEKALGITKLLAHDDSASNGISGPAPSLNESGLMAAAPAVSKTVAGVGRHHGRWLQLLGTSFSVTLANGTREPPRPHPLPPPLWLE